MSDFAQLERFVRPQAIAVIGASSRESSQGQRLLENLAVHSSPGIQLFPVNPAYQQLDDQECWPSVDALPAHKIDIALIIVNASLVVETLNQCAAKAIPFAIVMTSGFAEIGEEGQALEDSITALCQRTGLRVYGPNCPGFVNIRDRIGMTFSPAFKNDLNSGSIGLITQGGGLGRNILQGLAYGVGAGLWFSPGNEVDLDVADFISYMAEDPATKVIAILMEGIRDGRRLAKALALARKRNKPVVVLKVGRSAYGATATQSHTAALAGSSAVNSSVFRQFGATEVNDLDELIAVSRMLTKPYQPTAAGICVYTFSGGAAAFAADAIGIRNLLLAEFTEDTTRSLRACLPSFAATSNPVDTTGEVLKSPELIQKCLEIVCADPNVGIVLFPIPMDYGPITQSMAWAIVHMAQRTDKYIIPVWMSRTLGPGFDVLEKNGISPFFSMSSAVSSIERVLQAHFGSSRPRSAKNALPIQQVQYERHVLDEFKAKQMLSNAGIKIPASRLAFSAKEAAEVAKQIGFPVAMKIVSAQILHKTDVGGVHLGITTPEEASLAFELINTVVSAKCPDAILDGVLVESMLPSNGEEMLIGIHRDPAFGSMVTLGLGGIFVETLNDVSHRMIPITHHDAIEMIDELKHGELLNGVRGKPPLDRNALANLLVEISSFALSHPTISEADFNPIWVGPIGMGAIPLDALIVLDEAR